MDILKMAKISLIIFGVLVAILGIRNIYLGISKNNKEIRGSGLNQLFISAIMLIFSFGFQTFFDMLLS